jgi:4-amino-4-deoxy-L-arabinose transferase-like glycosyltransferase
MSLAADVRPATAFARARSEPWITAAALALAAGLICTALRLVDIGRAQDIFVDEPIYTALGHSALSTPFPRVDGYAFFLHPPGFFYLEAAWEWLFGYRADLVARVDEMRQLNALLAGGTAMTLVLLVMRATGSLRAATAGAALYALDAFCIRQSGRVLIETSMMLWVLLGYFVLLGDCDAEGRAARVRAICGGLLFGLAILTKDEAVFVTILPILVVAAVRWRPRSRSSLWLVACSSTVPYAIYVVSLAAGGHLGQFWAAKSAGALRLAGILQISGFNSPRAPGLVNRLVTELPSFGPTYLLLALSLPATVVVYRRGDGSQRLLALLGAAATLLLGYSVFLGTLEEQELYVMLVPAFVTISVAGVLIGSPGRTPRRLAIAGWSLFAIAIAANVHTYLEWRLHPDDGYPRLRRYMAAHLAPGTTIGVADTDPANGASEKGPSARILEDRYRVSGWRSARDRSLDGVRYLVVPWTEVEQGYSQVSVSAVRREIRDAQLLFSFKGRTYGTLALYRLPATAVSASRQRAFSR